MVGVPQTNLGMDIVAEFVLVHGLYRGGSTNGHKDGGLNLTVVGGDESGASA